MYSCSGMATPRSAVPIAPRFPFILVRYEAKLVHRRILRKCRRAPRPKGAHMGTPPDTSRSDDASVQRDEGDDDLDLLTYNEARARLAEELSAEKEHLVALRAQSADNPASAAAARDIAACGHGPWPQNRARRRTAARAVTDANARLFYGSDL